MKRQIANETNDFKTLRSSQIELHLAHFTPGRTRYHLAPIYENVYLSCAVENRLKGEPEFQKVQARWKTGSLVIDHNFELPVDNRKLRKCIVEALHRPHAYQTHENTSLAKLSNVAPSRDNLSFSSRHRKYVIQDLQSDSLRGLDDEDVMERRRIYGENMLELLEITSQWNLFARQFNNSTTALLSGSALLSMFMGGAFDAVMISGVVLINGVIGYMTEAHADRVISSIGTIEEQEVKVVRSGLSQSIRDRDLVLGDIVELTNGVIPADIRLLHASGLMVDESPLTGESMPVAKTANVLDPAAIETTSDYRNLLFRGTIITSGQGRGIVIGTGQRTEIGRIRSLVETTKQLESPLQKELQTVGQHTVLLSSAVCGGIFLIGLWRGRAFLDMLQTSVHLAVAAVPEGLPTIGTTTMAIGVSNLKKQNVFPRRLNVLEALGSIEILCLDKTGTVTMNDMIAEEGFFGFSRWQRSIYNKQTPNSNPIELHRWGTIAALCNDCELLSKKDGHPPRWSGSATEKAIVELVELIGVSVEKLKTNMPRFKTPHSADYGRSRLKCVNI